MPDYTIFKLKVSMVTPLHIGNGVDLLNEYDYAIHQGQTWRINEAALLEAQEVEDPSLAEKLARTPPAHLLKPADYQSKSPLFRYVIKGTPRSQAEGAQVHEQIKDTFDRLYLPGSSLKGALRTALGWYAWGRLRLEPDFRKLKRSRQWAGQEYEQDIFGVDPNHDLLRALHVSDSQPVETEHLLILNVRVLNRRGGLESPIELEAVRPDTSFRMDLKIDQALFSAWASQHHLVLRGGEWLQDLVGAVRAHTRQRIQDETKWFEGIQTARKPLEFYRRFAQLQEQLGENRFFIQIGWGTGWDDKTFGSHLRTDERFMERVIGEYHLSRGRRQEGDPFPKSRRIAVTIARSPQGQALETPAYPLGWVLVELEKSR